MGIFSKMYYGWRQVGSAWQRLKDEFMGVIDTRNITAILHTVMYSEQGLAKLGVKTELATALCKNSKKKFALFCRFFLNCVCSNYCMIVVMSHYSSYC